MSITHHPGEDSLLAYATGKLCPGAALAVGGHVEACTHCAAEVAFLERIGGALLESDAAEAVAAGALDRALAALDKPPTSTPPVRPGLPGVLAGRRVGRWRWAGPGLRIASLDDEAGRRERLYLLKGRAGARLPEHGHRGAERMLVLEGAVLDGEARFGPGDLCERDAGDRHRPAVARDADCICLVAIEGRVRLSGVARWLQPFLGI